MDVRRTVWNDVPVQNTICVAQNNAAVTMFVTKDEFVNCDCTWSEALPCAAGSNH